MRGVLGVFVAVLLSSSGVAFAEGTQPEPGVTMSLDERGPCSVIACEPMIPRKRTLIEREIAIYKRVLRNADLRPKHRELMKLHNLYLELLHAAELELNTLRAHTLAAGSRS